MFEVVVTAFLVDVGFVPLVWLICSSLVPAMLLYGVLQATN